jgi:hypothetical protein
MREKKEKNTRKSCSIYIILDSVHHVHFRTYKMTGGCYRVYFFVIDKPILSPTIETIG